MGGGGREQGGGREGKATARVEKAARDSGREVACEREGMSRRNGSRRGECRDVSPPSCAS